MESLIVQSSCRVNVKAILWNFLIVGKTLSFSGSFDLDHTDIDSFSRANSGDSSFLESIAKHSVTRQFKTNDLEYTLSTKFDLQISASFLRYRVLLRMVLKEPKLEVPNSGSLNDTI